MKDDRYTSRRHQSYCTRRAQDGLVDGESSEDVDGFANGRTDNDHLERGPGLGSDIAGALDLDVVSARSLFYAVLGLTFACGQEVRIIDVRQVEGPALAFAVDTEDGQPLASSGSIIIDADGKVVRGSSSFDAQGSATQLLVIATAHLVQSAGPFGRHLMQDELHRSQLLLRSPKQARVVNAEDDAWLAMPIPDQTYQLPVSATASLDGQVELQIPIRSNHSCTVGGTIHDFDVTYPQPPTILDLVALGDERLVVLHGPQLSLVQAGDSVDLLDPSDPKVLASEPGLRFEAIEKVPGVSDEIWAALRGAEGGELLRLRVTDRFELIERIVVAELRPRSLGVSLRGIAALGGEIVADQEVFGVAFIAQGQLTVLPTGPKSLSLSVLAEPSTSGSDRFLVGTRGAALRYRIGDSAWTRATLSHRRGAPFPNAMALRSTRANFELVAASDDGVLLRQVEDQPSETLEIFSPPNYRCHAENAVASLNFRSIVLYKNRFALLGMNRCSDILVVDLEDPSCTAFIPYENSTVSSASLESLSLDGDRLWIAGRRGELRYVDLVAP